MSELDTIIEAGIIEPSQLHELLQSGSTNIRILDSSFVLPTSAENPYQNFLKSRIADAQFFDIKCASDLSSALPNMMPSENVFSDYISKLGISNDDLVVVYGQAGMVMGPARVWWMLRAFGHERACVLNGGLPAWKRDGFEVSKDSVRAVEKTTFDATLRPELVLNMETMKNAANDKAVVLDARSSDRFSGAVDEPRAGLRSGHIPGSVNLPCISLIDQNSGKLKSDEHLRDIFFDLGINADSIIFTTCGSGVTACVIVLALHKIGYKDVPVYDGSWSEWGMATSSTEIEKSA